MDGQLSDRPFAEIISEIMSARLSGALRLARERAKAAVYFAEGRVVGALSNLRAHRLAEQVRRAALVSEEQLAELTSGGATDERVAAGLLRSGALAREELVGLLTAQSIEVLRLLLRWEDGAWEFDPRVRLASEHRAQPEVGRLLVERVRELPDEPLIALLPDAELLAPPDEAPDNEKLARLGLSPIEAFILSRVTAPATLAELLLVGGLPEAETRRAAYALTLCGLLKRPNLAATFTPEELRKSGAPAPNAPAIWAEAQPPPPVPDEAPAAFASEKPVAATAERTAASGPPSAAADSQEEVRAAMEELLEMSRKETHYEVLGVLRTARPEEIKRAYHSIARRLHPDRFRRDAAGEFVRQLDVSFARVTQAYEVLKDSSLRASYDLKLSTQTSAARSNQGGARIVSERGGPAQRDEPARATTNDERPSVGNAEEKFQRGLEASRKGDYATARRLFGEAALVAPRQARYRAYYGRELARDRATRRQAEAELQAAISLDEKNPAYRVMLAELYLEVGLRRRAEGELRRALDIAPGHDEARRLLQRIGASA
jgi:curved DNA-binding protein CbpA